MATLFRYEAKGGFEALAKMKSGEWRSLHGKMKLSLATRESDGQRADSRSGKSPGGRPKK